MAHFWKLLFGHIRNNDELPYILRYRQVAKRIPNLRMCKGKTDVSFIVAWRHPCHSTRIWVCLKWSTPKPSDLSSCSPWISTCWVYLIFRHHFLVWRSDRQSSTSGLLSPRKQAHSPELDTLNMGLRMCPLAIKHGPENPQGIVQCFSRFFHIEMPIWWFSEITQISNFNRIFQYKQSILGCLYFRKPSFSSGIS